MIFVEQKGNHTKRSERKRQKKLENMIEKIRNNTGVFPPETIGEKEGCLDFILAYLNDRNVSVTKK